MKYFQPIITLSLLIFSLIVISRDCLFEQALAAVAESLPHGYHTPKAYDHDMSAPSHSHDKKGHEDEFCCDNDLNLYVGNEKFVPALTFQKLNSSISVLIETKETVKSNQFDFYLYRLWPPFSVRARDNYAQTCLLHAPPHAHVNFSFYLRFYRVT
jgi:hypothetical protein